MKIAALLALLLAAPCRAEVTQASWYSEKSAFAEGGSGFTASMERFEDEELTCAMRRRAWGLRLKVTNLANGKSVVLRLNDFGPNEKLWKAGRHIDLSKAAFKCIADLRDGVIWVRVEELKPEKAR